MRCFVAVEIPDGVKAALAQVSARLRECRARASWVRTEHMHLTLRFLGDVDYGKADSFAGHLREALGGIGAFPLQVRGVGAFPNARRPSVVWAGVGPADGALGNVQALCEQAALAIDLPREAKPFHPHITLARIKSIGPNADLTLAIEREAACPAGEFIASSVSLFKCELTPRGPIYTLIEEFPFR